MDVVARSALEQRPQLLAHEADLTCERDQLADQLFAFADDDHVAERQERGWIRERERPTRDDERMAIISLVAQRRNVRALERLDDAGDLELVRDRIREYRIAANRLAGLERVEPPGMIRS